MSWPSAITTPEVAVTMPQTMLMRVVLPAALGPSRAKISPFWISRSTFFSAARPEAYVLVSFEMEMTGTIRATIAHQGDRARAVAEKVARRPTPQINGPDLPSPLPSSMIEGHGALPSARRKHRHALEGAADQSGRPT